MHTDKDDFHELNQSVRQLSQQLSLAEKRYQNSLRTQRWLLVIAILVVAVFISSNGNSESNALSSLARGLDASATASSPRAAPTPEQIEAKQAQLKAQLSEEQRRELEEFEIRVRWLSQYMQTWDENQAGAVVALMLHRVAENMDSVPKMHEEMIAMNSLMRSLPVMTTEMQRMSANIAVMTANMGVMTRDMDSTMGRMGRMMPWMP